MMLIQQSDIVMFTRLHSTSISKQSHFLSFSHSLSFTQKHTFAFRSTIKINSVYKHKHKYKHNTHINVKIVDVWLFFRKIIAFSQFDIIHSNSRSRRIPSLTSSTFYFTMLMLILLHHFLDVLEFSFFIIVVMNTFVPVYNILPLLNGNQSLLL